MIDKTKAELIAENHVRKLMTFRMKPVEDTSNLDCYEIDDLSDYHVFWFSDDFSKRFGLLTTDSYVAVHKKDGTVVNFEY